MTKKEKAIESRIAAKQTQIKRLHNDIMNLRFEANKCGDYRVEIETHGRGKNKRTEKIGRKYWKEKFDDEDTGKFVTIERSRVVSINGKPVDEFGNPFKYFEIK
jgi:hypothetical protein